MLLCHTTAALCHDATSVSTVMLHRAEIAPRYRARSELHTGPQKQHLSWRLGHLTRACILQAGSLDC